MKAGSLEIANSVAWIFSRGQANGVTRTPSSTKTLKLRAWQHVGACIRCTPFLRLLLLVILYRRFILIYFVLYLNNSVPRVLLPHLKGEEPRVPVW